MAPKDKPYSNETRPVDFNVNYTKRKGSKSIFARGKVKNKEGVGVEFMYGRVNPTTRKPINIYDVGVEIPIFGGTGSLEYRRTPGEKGIGRPTQKAIMGRLSIPFNKGGKVKKHSKRKKK